VKYYIELKKSTFVCEAESPSHAIAKLWDRRFAGELGDGDEADIEATYRIHIGQSRNSFVITAAIAWWMLPVDRRPIVREWIESESPADHDTFCAQIIHNAPDHRK